MEICEQVRFITCMAHLSSALVWRGVCCSGSPLELFQCLYREADGSSKAIPLTFTSGTRHVALIVLNLQDVSGVYFVFE